MKIACWSGPRNISTALMRSWSSRKDTFVSDEPFYAYYLRKTGLKHPMAKEIIEYYPNSYKQVVNSINKKIPKKKEIWYQKHMAHHLISYKDISWIKKFYNCFLIRHPKDVIYSYIQKNKLNHIDELGYTQQNELIKYLKEHQQQIIIIDSSILLENPNKILGLWCNKLKIDFDLKMLRWKKGFYKTEGIWCQHWYDNVINTTHFETKAFKEKIIPKEYEKIYNHSLSIYESMLEFAEK